MRDALIRNLAEQALAVVRPHPTRICVDGIDASGKTHLADELAAALADSGRQIIRASVDGFHRPRAERLRRGEGPESYYHDSHDYPLVCQALLAPLGPGGDRRFRTAHFDFRTDTPAQTPLELAADDAILIMDGIFLQRPELYEHWDLRIFLHASFETSLGRGQIRDAALFGEGAKTLERYRTRYVPGQKLYLDTVRPAERAHIAIDNDDWQRPVLLGDGFLARP